MPNFEGPQKDVARESVANHNYEPISGFTQEETNAIYEGNTDEIIERLRSSSKEDIEKAIRAVTFTILRSNEPAGDAYFIAGGTNSIDEPVPPRDIVQRNFEQMAKRDPKIQDSLEEVNSLNVFLGALKTL